MAKTYGRKVKRSKKIYKRRKTKLRIAAEITITVVIAAGLAVVGYSAGKPLLEFLRGEGKAAEATGEVLQTTDESETMDSEESESANSDETTAVETQPQVPDETARRIAYTPNSALTNASALSAYVLQLKADGCNAAVIELKDASGSLWYKSDLPDVKGKEFIKGGLSPVQIKAIFDNVEIGVIVKLCTLQDPISPSVYDDISYRFENGSYNWHDNTIEKGGKLWANPFLDGTKKYISDLVSELDSAGFSEIILSGMIFPNMTGYDISVLPPQVTNMSNRYTALTELFELCKSKCVNSKLYIESTITDIAENYSGFQKTAEILKGKNTLSETVVIVTMNRSEIGSELSTGIGSSVSLPSEPAALVTALYKQAARNVSPLNLIPAINTADYNTAELEAVINAFEDMGYNELILR